ncbi:hypothetical protein ACQPU1_12190 [Clostridium paraputrificum]|uniref:hypothetical protein n=1 Tax=Clostridium paraputrificum TaxID=29363 RepID=UPI003D34829C
MLFNGKSEFKDPKAFEVEIAESLINRKKYYLKSEDRKLLIESNEWALARDKIMLKGCKVWYMCKD